MSFQDLVTELNTDPETIGYSGMTDHEVLTSLTSVSRTRNKTSMTGSEVLNAIVISEFNAIVEDSDKQMVWDLVHLGTLDPFGKEATLLTSIFGGGSDTIIALGVARKEFISRLAELGLRKPALSDIAKARA